MITNIAKVLKGEEEPVNNKTNILLTEMYLAGRCQQALNDGKSEINIDHELYDSIYKVMFSIMGPLSPEVQGHGGDHFEHIPTGVEIFRGDDSWEK